MAHLMASLDDYTGRDEMRSQATWEEDARCRGFDPRLWDTHHLRGKTEITDDVRDAKEICADCPVKFDCLTHGIRWHSRFMIRGGMTDEERDAWARKALPRYGHLRRTR